MFEELSVNPEQLKVTKNKTVPFRAEIMQGYKILEKYFSK